GSMVRMFVLSLVLLSGLAFSPQSDAMCGTVRTFQDGAKRLALLLNENDLKAAPQWEPEKGEPPLSPARVVEIARRWAKAKSPRFDELRVQEILLAPAWCDKGYWYYFVELDPVVDGHLLYSNAYSVAVLMDGKVVGLTEVK